MARKKPPLDPRICAAQSRVEQADAAYERAYARMRRAVARMEKARRTRRRALKLIAAVTAELEAAEANGAK